MEIFTSTTDNVTPGFYSTYKMRIGCGDQLQLIINLTLTFLHILLQKNNAGVS